MFVEWQEERNVLAGRFRKKKKVFQGGVLKLSARDAPANTV